ncbi:hypothetical protein EVAR_82971_1 [Eumeta japonica]|uniref:Uncharacterized protein n=1 Tax=Eumeta variegata TaxID=151549 RepID=A0A4C1VQS3_EUMVA|nr:hypothetical protein EVAR_82971_1 [Eumeta japonica]
MTSPYIPSCTVWIGRDSMSRMWEGTDRAKLRNRSGQEAIKLPIKFTLSDSIARVTSGALSARGRPIIVEWERRKAFGGPLSSVTHRYVTERYIFISDSQPQPNLRRCHVKSGRLRRGRLVRLLGGAVAGGRRAARRQRQPRHAVRHARHVLPQRRQETHPLQHLTTPARTAYAEMGGDRGLAEAYRANRTRITNVSTALLTPLKANSKYSPVHWAEPLSKSIS